MSQAERDANQMAIDSALQSVDRIAATTEFDGQRVLDGSMTITADGANATIASAATTDLGQIVVNGSPQTLSDAASGGAMNSSRGGAAGAAASIAAAADQIATARGQIGAFESNVIEPQSRGNAVAFENAAAARSAIVDTDYAAESAKLVRGRILQDATLGALAMANSAPGSVLRLLG